MRAQSSIHWTAYPALLVAGAFAAGVWVASDVGSTTPIPWFLGSGAGIGLFLLVQWWDRRRLVTLAPLGRFTAIVLTVASAGAGSYATYHHASPHSLRPVAEASSNAVRLTGTVADSPERSSNRVRFTLTVTQVGTDTALADVNGAAVVTLQSDPWQSDRPSVPLISQGDNLRLKGELRPAPGQRNPGGFDYAAYLARRAVCCTMYVDAGSGVLEVDRTRSTLTDLVVRLRRHVRRQIDRFVPTAPARSVLEALLLADRSGITDEQEEHFARTGLMHLLAVSGLHVFLVGMVLYVLLQPLLLRFRLRWRVVEIGRAVLTVLVLGVYLVITGARPSVVRAVVMSALFIGGVLFQRSTHSLNTLGVAALVLLVVRPPALFDAGFQLSIAAVAGILTLQPRVEEAVPDSWQESAVGDWLISMVGVSAVATVATAPVLFVHFGWVSGAGLLLNILGIPFTALALASAIAMQLFAGVWPVLGAAFGSAADLFVHALLLTSKRGFDWLGWLGVRMANPTPWTLVPLLSGLLALVQWPRPRIRWRLIVITLLIATAGTWMGIARGPSRPTLDLLFFDVGQGDAILLSTPGNRHVLVDTGPRGPDGNSAAAYSVLPYLKQEGIDHLEMVVVTHPDEDHLGGLPILLREVSIGRVVSSGQPADTELYRESQRRLARRAVLELYARRGDTLSVTPNTRVEVLGPPRQPRRRGLDDVNERSVVLRVSYGKIDVLLPGDVESDAERGLVRAYGKELESSVVKVPHHGSSTSSTRPFVRAVMDSSFHTRAIVSVGASNAFGMPDEAVVSRWRRQGARVSTTAQDGAVWLRTDGRSVWRENWR